MDHAADALMAPLWELLEAGTNDDDAKVTEIFNGVVDMGEPYTFAFLVGLSMIIASDIKRALGEPRGRVQMFPQIFDSETGQPISPEDAGLAPAFAARFVTAVCSDDRKLPLALWNAFMETADDEAVSKAFTSIVGIAVGVAKKRTGGE